MRISFDLDPAVVRELRRRATLEGKSIGQFASDLLAAATTPAPQAAGADFVWISADLGTPRSDLENAEAVGQA